MPASSIQGRERLAKVEQKLDDLIIAVNSLKEDILNLKQEFESMCKENDRKYASKWTEKILLGFIASVIGAGITAIIIHLTTGGI